VRVKLGEAAAQAGHDHWRLTTFNRRSELLNLLIATGTTDLDAVYAAADAYSGSAT